LLWEGERVRERLATERKKEGLEEGGLLRTGGGRESLLLPKREILVLSF
jgi:hypothetical protein